MGDIFTRETRKKGLLMPIQKNEKSATATICC